MVAGLPADEISGGCVENKTDETGELSCVPASDTAWLKTMLVEVAELVDVSGPKVELAVKIEAVSLAKVEPVLVLVAVEFVLVVTFEMVSGDKPGIVAKLDTVSGAKLGIVIKLETVPGDKLGMVAKLESVSGAKLGIVAKLEIVSVAKLGVMGKLAAMLADVVETAVGVGMLSDILTEGTMTDTAVGDPVIEDTMDTLLLEGARLVTMLGTVEEIAVVVMLKGMSLNGAPMLVAVVEAVVVVMLEEMEMLEAPLELVMDVIVLKDELEVVLMELTAADMAVVVVL